MGEREVRARHIPRFFNIEAKEFRIKVDDLSSGGSILIMEKVRNRFFHLSLEIRCVARLINELLVLLTNNESVFFRKFKGDSYQVWLERCINLRGTHLRISKCVHGTVKSVIVPQGRSAEGWLRLKENLQLCLDGKEDRGTVKTGSSSESARSGHYEKTYKDVIGTRSVERAKTSKSVKLDASTNSDWVVVCERQVVHQSWNDVSRALTDRI